MPEVKVVGATKKFRGKILAVDHVSAQINDKEYFSLVGPSGCGKTTLLRLIAGLVKPDEGEIYIEGKMVNEVPPEDRGIGFVFQTYALFPHMNVWENVTYGPKVKAWDGESGKRIGNEMLEMVRLHDRSDAFPRELSGGMMQRVAVARALAAGAKLLLLDEPLGALDAKIRLELRSEIRRLAKDLGLTAIHVTHDQAEAMAISDRIAVMRKGKILQIGTPQELYMNPQHIFVAHFIGEANFLAGNVAEVQGDKLVVELRGGLSLQTLGKAYKKGDRVVLAVRPEVLKVEEKKQASHNSLFGRIERVAFEGNQVRYQVNLENEDHILVIRSTLIAEQLNIGETITIVFPSDKIFVFPYPEKGLIEELALE